MLCYIQSNSANYSKAIGPGLASDAKAKNLPKRGGGEEHWNI
jgi:hypothetical protein